MVSEGVGRLVIIYPVKDYRRRLRETDRLCRARDYEHSEGREDTRAAS